MDDLFKLFPDLPWLGRTSSASSARDLQQDRVAMVRERARRNTERQRAAAERVRRRVALWLAEHARRDR